MRTWALRLTRSLIVAVLFSGLGATAYAMPRYGTLMDDGTCSVLLLDGRQAGSASVVTDVADRVDTGQIESCGPADLK